MKTNSEQLIIRNVEMILNIIDANVDDLRTGQTKQDSAIRLQDVKVDISCIQKTQQALSGDRIIADVDLCHISQLIIQMGDI